jgi:hypothetical protein
MNWALWAVHQHKKWVSMDNIKKAKKLANEGTNSDSLNVATKSLQERSIHPT